MTLVRPELIVFDLDGTLVDSAPDLAYSLDTLLAELGRAPAGVERVRGWIGNGVAMLVKRGLTFEMWPEGEPEGFAEALPRFMAIYADNLCERSKLYPGVLEGIRALKAEGYKLACLTNKHSDFTEPLLEKLGVAQELDYIGCGNQFEKHKPHPEPLLKTAERFGVRPEHCLMVGDSENDVEAARAAGYAIVCLPYGYRRCADAQDLKADALIDSIADLPGLLVKQAA
ncbi:phosphoglycolate phosphatase [Methylococcus sp. EFPC2]|uniref:phosphoglycolate phosphatase n=1 Tax=Methylococcus sp. EFPC2 TaxID=2812648 RepID=UPI001967595F|nr:phosphoglycolate phosphatase [Methylococcus sp. EFPC2]QSA96382.1 phosphoglycolate phosphatase [Methylococcus sp. EFPC2]